MGCVRRRLRAAAARHDAERGGAPRLRSAVGRPAVADRTQDREDQPSRWPDPPRTSTGPLPTPMPGFDVLYVTALIEAPPVAPPHLGRYSQVTSSELEDSSGETWLSCTLHSQQAVAHGLLAELARLDTHQADGVSRFWECLRRPRRHPYTALITEHGDAHEWDAVLVNIVRRRETANGDTSFLSGSSGPDARLERVDSAKS